MRRRAAPDAVAHVVGHDIDPIHGTAQPPGQRLVVNVVDAQGCRQVVVLSGLRREGVEPPAQASHHVGVQLLVDGDLPVHVDSVVVVPLDEPNHIGLELRQSFGLLQKGPELLLPAEAEQDFPSGSVHFADHSRHERHVARRRSVVERIGPAHDLRLRKVEIQRPPLRGRRHQIDEIERFVTGAGKFGFAQQALHRVGGMNESGRFGDRARRLRTAAGEQGHREKNVFFHFGSLIFKGFRIANITDFTAKIILPAPRATPARPGYRDSP